MLSADYGLFDHEITDRTEQRTSRAKKISTERGLPENTNYIDTGCELAPSCLECPLALCKYDDPHLRLRSNKVMRNTEILRLYRSGAKISKIAVQVNTSERTVYRIIQRDIESARSVSKNSHASSENLGSIRTASLRRGQLQTYAMTSAGVA